MVGTLNYLSPEMMKHQISVIESDLWALGCIIFKMTTGRVPFPGVDMITVRNLILQRQIDWQDDFIEPECKDLIEKLLIMSPRGRLGAPDTDHDILALMAHPFFKGIDFNGDLSKLELKKIISMNLPQGIQFVVDEPKEQEYPDQKKA